MGIWMCLFLSILCATNKSPHKIKKNTVPRIERELKWFWKTLCRPCSSCKLKESDWITYSTWPNVKNLLDSNMFCMRRSESERMGDWRRRSGRVKAGCARDYGKDERWENRARGGGDEESKIEELPPRHSSILPLWWEHISPVLWPSSFSLSHIRSHTLAASHSSISTRSFLPHFCSVFLLSHSSLLLIGISSYSQMSATFNTYFYVQSAHECEHTGAVYPSAPPCLYMNSCQFPPDILHLRLHPI